MYKKIITTNLLLFASLISFSQKKTFELSSQIENLEGKEVSITIWDGTSTTRNAKVSITNGQIQYSEEISSPLVIRVIPINESLVKRSSARGNYATRARAIWFVVQPGSKVKLVGKLTDFAEAYAEGGKENEIFTALNREYHPLINKEVNLRVKIVRDTSLTTEEKQRMRREGSELAKEALTVLKKHIMANPSSIMALYFMNDLMLRKQMTNEEAAALLKQVDNKYKKTGFYELVSNRLNAGEFVEGAKILEISAPMPHGQMFSNTSLKGKYYLIDFWGTWCGPCMADIPNLQVLKKKYEGKLEILGINQGDTEEKWKNAVTSKGLNWYNIMNGKSEKDFVSRLNVTGFPTKILVDPNGLIIYRSTGYGEESIKKVEAYIKQK